MKKIILTSILTTFGILIFALPTFAATTASLSPVTVNVTAGQSFNVTIAVNPQGVSNDVEKLEIDFPANDLEVTSFTLANTWTALVQPGYDSTDNTNGVLIKTAGYPGGFSSNTAFGTITFYAKKSGSGTITIGNDSTAFVVSGQNAITGSGSVFTISANTAVPAKNVTETTASTVIKKVVGATPTKKIASSTSNIQVATVAEVNCSTSYVWLLVLLNIIELAVIGWLVYERKTK